MKIVELLNNISLAITNEEAELLQTFDTDNRILKSELDPRQQLIAGQLVNKDLLRRFREDGKIIFTKRIA